MSKQIMLLRSGVMLTMLVVFGLYAAGHAQTPAEKTGVISQEPSSDAKTSIAQNTEHPASQDAEKKTETKKDEAEEESAIPRRSKTHFHLGTVTVGASYTNFGHAFIGPFYPFYGYQYPYYPYYPYGAFSVGAFYTTYFSDPFYGPYSYYAPYAPGFGYAAGKGEVKLASLGRNKDASVYIDNGYAGPADKLKQMWLDPGAYDLSLQAADGSTFRQRIYVLSGKTLKIAPEFKVEKTPQREEKK